MNEDIALTADLPAVALTYAQCPVSCLQSVNARLYTRGPRRPT